MIPVTSNGQQFWLNFQHTELPGAKVREIPPYRELVELLRLCGKACTPGQWRFRNGDMVTRYDERQLADPSWHLSDIVPHLVDGVLQRYEHGLDPCSHRTVCNITRKVGADSRELVAFGESLTLKGDQFSRRTGRWWSLTRAMEDVQAKGFAEAGDVLAAYLARPQADPDQELEAYVGWYETEYLAKYPRVFSYWTDTPFYRYLGAAA